MTTYRVWNVVYIGDDPFKEGGRRVRHIEIEPEDERYTCCGPDVRELIAAQLAYTDNDGATVEPLKFDYRAVKESAMVGVEAFTFGFTDIAYGGSEEGGWYYDTFQPVRVFIVKKGRAHVAMRRIERKFKAEGWHPGRESWSFRWGIVESSEPRFRPHYC